VKAWTGTDNDVSKANTNTVTVTGPRSVTVEFELIPPMQYQLDTSVIGGHGTIVPPSGPQDANKVVDLTATPDAGYRVKHWTGTDNDASKANTNTVTMIGPKSVTVEFEAIPITQYQLSTKVVGGRGTIAPPSGLHDANSVVGLTATPEAGYRVKQWTGTDDNASKANTNTVTITESKAVTVEFELEAYQLTVNHGSGSGTYTCDQAANIEANVPQGKRFDRWTGDLANVAEPNAPNTVVVMRTNTMVTATFIDQYALTVNGGNGSGLYDANAVVPIVAVIPEGKRFDKWTGNTSNVADANEPNTTVTMKGEATVSAGFISRWTLKVTTEGPGVVSQKPADVTVFDEGARVTLTASPLAGDACDRFLGWSGDANSTEPSLTVTMDSNKEITATFYDGKLGPAPCCGQAVCEVTLMSLAVMLFILRAKRQ
jgi:hypothetical protein